jgi:phosphoglycerate kinase
MIKYGFNIKTIHDTKIENKKVLVRVDFDVSLNAKHQIADDTRLQKALPTIQELLKNKNKVILVSKLGRPKGQDASLSISPVAKELQKCFPSFKVILVEDFLSGKGKEILGNQTEKEIMLLENIRFYEGEKENNAIFSKQLASLADVFVLDAFAMSHRKEASVTGVTHFLPSFAGLELENEVNAIAKAIQDPKKPVVAIMGGAKIADKLAFVGKLIEAADYLLVGGGIANTFLYASGYGVGKSLCDKTEKEHVEKLFALAKKHETKIVLPADVVGLTGKEEKTFPINHVPESFEIFDIGPETEATFGSIISKAKTIIWNGPVGYFEKEPFNHGTDFLFYTIADNEKAYSLVGGGDTLAAISKKEYVEKISHISTGGGAMLELIENGTLPGLEALSNAQHR